MNKLATASLRKCMRTERLCVRVPSSTLRLIHEGADVGASTTSIVAVWCF